MRIVLYGFSPIPLVAELALSCRGHDFHHVTRWEEASGLLHLRTVELFLVDQEMDNETARNHLVEELKKVGYAPIVVINAAAENAFTIGRGTQQVYAHPFDELADCWSQLMHTWEPFDGSDWQWVLRQARKSGIDQDQDFRVMRACYTRMDKAMSPAVANGEIGPSTLMRARSYLHHAGRRAALAEIEEHYRTQAAL